VVPRPLVLGEAVRDVRRLQLAEHLADRAAGARGAVHGGVDLEDAVEGVGRRGADEAGQRDDSPARRPQATTMRRRRAGPPVGSGWRWTGSRSPPATRSTTGSIPRSCSAAPVSAAACHSVSVGRSCEQA
jgi:hypothetical protein